MIPGAQRPWINTPIPATNPTTLDLFLNMPAEIDAFMIYRKNTMKKIFAFTIFALVYFFEVNAQDLEPIPSKRTKKNFDFDRNQIIEALGCGRSFVVNHYYGSGTGFRFFAEYDGEHYFLGDEIKFRKSKNKKILFRTFLPSAAKIRLIHNGKCVDELVSLDCIWDSDEAGSYRIEAWKHDRGWIFSNHIRVTEE